MQPSSDAAAYYTATAGVPPTQRASSPPASPAARLGIISWIGAAVLLMTVLAGALVWQSARSNASAQTAPLTAPATLGGLPLLNDPVASEGVASIQTSYAQRHPGHAAQPAFYGSRPFTVNLMLYRGDLSRLGDPRLVQTSASITDHVRCGLAFGKYADCWRASRRLSVSVLTLDSPDQQRAATMVNEAWQAASVNTQVK